MDEKTWMTTVCVSESLLKRLSSYTWSKDEGEPKAKGVGGTLYGVRAAHLSKYALLLNATGKKIFEDDRKPMEILSEILPCGLDAYGVFYLSENQEDERDEIGHLIQQLPDALLATNDPVVLVRRGTTIKAFIHHEGELIDGVLKPYSDESVATNIATVRVRGKLAVECIQNEVEISNGFKNLIEKVASPCGSFHLENSDVFFLHTFRAKSRPMSGWTVGEGDFIQEDTFEEDCLVTNIHELDIEGKPNDNENREVYDLWNALKQEEEEDDGFGPTEATPKQKAKVVKRSQTMNFRLKMKMSGEACTSKTLNCSPVISYEKRDVKSIKIPLKIDAIGFAANSMRICDLMEVLKGAVQRQIHEMARGVLSEFKMRGTVSIPEAFHLKPPPLGHMLTIIYTKTGTCANFAQFRKHLHEIFLIPVERPLFRRMNRFVFDEEKAVGKGVLQNVHVGLEAGSKDLEAGEVCLVDGIYSYHHYMQDKFNDDGWGCAYRSLQTLISWFRHQGYTATTLPTHSQIQKCLVKVGDKEKDFIDSKQWIGSTEVGFVLEESCGVQSKILSVNSGDDMPSKARELADHFKNQGTPVMIGGGVLAHTILGVHWNEDTGDVRWLILDPHFTGSDWTSNGHPNTAFIQSKGWVGWKGPDFWVKGAFYNMCLPQRPHQW